MLERFTERARRVIILATEEARRRRHDAVSSEHLLIGILRDGGGLAVNVLERLRVDLQLLRTEVEQVLGEAPESATAAEPGFSPELRAVLEAALEERRRHGHNYVGTEHLLVGLLSDGRSTAGPLLHAAGADLDEARQMIMLCLGDQRIPLTEENVRFIATSKWRLHVSPPAGQSEV